MAQDAEREPDALPSGFRVLQVTPRLEGGGVERATLDISAAIVAAGGVSYVATEGGRLESDLEAHGGQAVRLPVASKNPMTIWANGRRLKVLIQTLKIDLVHVRSRAPAWSAVWAARQTGVPVVSTYHGIYSARSRMKRAYNALMTRADLVMANSRFTRDHVSEQHGVPSERLRLVPEGIDITRFDRGAVAPARVHRLRSQWGLRGDNRRLVLLPARLTRWKGQLMMIEAFAQARVEGLVLVLAGDHQGRDGYRDEIEAAIAERGLKDQVRLVGEVDDMPAAYLAADLVVTPSIRPESFGRTAVEAQLMGRPVLAADHGAARETVSCGRTGFLVQPGDLDAWTSRLVECADWSTDRLEDLGHTARRRARRRFSLEAMAGATFRTYRRAVRQRRTKRVAQ
ncbi:MULTISPECIES: glycosyltransferase family 4 protein [Brevundimonas]|uniref:glycosyltransferase family 4 protein n=1 Tax=Brevundimonas TaxID=41275 RepID=UPI000628052E|nr:MULTISPECIES: glycosyltransferase family 4 protein [Brevundimonas]MBN9479508.1 glycosyltransferase family 4 protein [Bordetella sp.]OMG58512.1 glycosyl transferase [Brevundimonas sp. ZS04]